MAHSKVYYDGESYVTLVEHIAFVNDLIDPADYCPISGLLEYILFPGDGVLKVYDPDDYELYEVHSVEDWEGLDKEAVKALLDAVDGVGDVTESAEEYRRVLKVHRDTGVLEKAVARHKIGTVVRIDYGYKDPGAADIALKVGDTSWYMAGSEDVWEDDEIEGYDYEVIYNA